MIQSIKMVPSGIKIGKQQIEIRKLFVEIENIARKLGLNINQGKTKDMIVERKNN